MIAARFSSRADLDHLRSQLIRQRQENKTIITVCSGTGCQACGCLDVTAAFKEVLRQSSLDQEVEVRATGCHGFCERGPLVVIKPEGIFYQRVRPSDVKLIVDQTIKGGKLVNRLLYRDPQTKETVVYEKDVPFYKKQMRLILGKNGFMDPTSINDFIALGGYQALSKALTAMKPDEIIEEVKKAVNSLPKKQRTMLILYKYEEIENYINIYRK